MPSTKHRDSRRPYVCARNRRMTTCVPWDERGDFVVASVTDWAKHTGSNPSRVILDALEWYFTNESPKWFYDRIVEKVESEEFKRLHTPDKGGFCHRMSCEHCYSRRHAHYAATNPALQAGPKRD